jgi:hypothetical protein
MKKEAGNVSTDEDESVDDGIDDDESDDDESGDDESGDDKIGDDVKDKSAAAIAAKKAAVERSLSWYREVQDYFSSKIPRRGIPLRNASGGRSI